MPIEKFPPGVGRSYRTLFRARGQNEKLRPSSRESKKIAISAKLAVSILPDFISRRHVGKTQHLLYVHTYILFLCFQTMAAKRNATGLTSAMPRASLNDEELVSDINLMILVIGLLYGLYIRLLRNRIWLEDGMADTEQLALLSRISASERPTQHARSLSCSLSPSICLSDCLSGQPASRP